MVAFSDVLPVGARAGQRPLIEKQAARGRRPARRAFAGVLRFAGVVLMLAAVGIWILSVPLLDAEMMLVRLAVSVLFMCCGLMLLHAGRRQGRDEIHLDPRSRELRHVHRGRDGIARTRRSLSLADIGGITVADNQLIVQSHAGDVLLELSGLPREQLHLIERELRRI